MHIKKKASPELLEQVKRGEVKIGTAHKGLEVTTTTVKKIFTEPEPVKGSSYFKKMAVSQLKRLLNLYAYLNKQGVFNDKAGGYPKISIRLKQHCDFTEGLIRRLDE